jgi:hypothetical protein
VERILLAAMEDEDKDEGSDGMTGENAVERLVSGEDWSMGRMGCVNNGREGSCCLLVKNQV